MFVGFLSLSLCLATIVLGSPEHTDHGAAAHKTSHLKNGMHNPVFDQEALMGSHNMDELADLEPEVRVRRLTTLAKSHDKDENGQIDRDELQQWVLESFRMLDHEEAMDRLKEDDDNEDGKVAFAEILKKQYGYTEEEMENLKKEEDDDDENADILDLIADDRKRFEVADQDKDGFLSESEYMAYFQPYDYPHMYDVEMAKTLKDMDKDKDGLVSVDEFVGDNTDEESRLSEVTNFEELDKDKDGKLTPEELRPWALPDNDEVAGEEVEHLFNMCDGDEDGKLSIEEIVTKEEEFISSSATDYGRNLHFVKDEL